MSWDRERYRREVLEPARLARNAPPRDLYARYGLGPGEPEPSVFTRQVDQVVGYWRELDHRGRYQHLARALLTAHSALERDGTLTPQRFAARYETDRREQARRLARIAEAEARSATHAGPVAVARLGEALSTSEAEVIAALRQAGIRVVSAFPELPAGQHPKQADLSQNVNQLGMRLSPEVLFGDDVRGGFRVLDGFRLTDGRGLDQAVLRAGRDRTAALPHTDPARAPTENVLAILGAAARRPGDLDALLLSEVVERLRTFAGKGFVPLTITQEARDLGLDKDEAGLLAGALVAEEAPDRTGAVRRQAGEALDDGRLRSAQRLAAELPAADPLLELLAARNARVAALSEEADRELAAGRREVAAVRLAHALELAADDPGLVRRLAALPPLPPRNVTATADGHHVLVAWESSPLLAGRLRFRVVRGQGGGPVAPAADTVVSAQTTQNRVIDEEAPPGTELSYSVFAGYGVLADQQVEVWSAPAAPPPVVLVADVASLVLATDTTSVTASWQPPTGAHAVLVRRAVGVPPENAADGTTVKATLTGFVDTGLRTGTEYRYRITVQYRADDGQRHHSPGVVVAAVPAPQPGPVTDLTVAVTGNGGTAAVACWTPPPQGEVRLAASDVPPPWRAGQRITSQAADGLRELPGVPRRRDDGRDYLALDLPSGRHYLLPLTVAGDWVVAGNAAEAELVEPVRGLVALRMHDHARLAWEWPRGATDAVIRWAGEERHCSKRVFDDEGGAMVTVGPAETLIEVGARYPHSGGPLTAPAASVLVPARGTAVRYRVYGGGRFRRRRRVVEFFPEEETPLPAVLVVRSEGRHVPGDPAEGETLLRIEPQTVTPGRRLRVTVDVRKGPGWLACFTEPATAEILLFPPPAEELRLR